MLAKRAIVIGSRGQDGSLLSCLLRERGYEIVGIDRQSCDSMLSWKESVDVNAPHQVDELISSVKPDEVYYLAATHQSSEGQNGDLRQLFYDSVHINVNGLFHVLDAIKRISSHSKVFYASSSHVFGEPKTPVQDEETPLAPRSVYGQTKSMGMGLCRLFRTTHNVFAACGILYNHESYLRGPSFLSKKIVSTALKIKAGDPNPLVLGNLSGVADWGYAPEYADAMTRILATENPDDFIVATGQPHTVQDFVTHTFSYLGMDWRPHVIEKAGVLSRKSVPYVGNPTKIHKVTGWRAKTEFKKMIELLIEAESKNQSGVKEL